MQSIPIESIIIKSPYLRTETDIEKLKQSISAVGLIAPLVINDKNELLAGGRRYSALKALGIKEVPVLRVDKNELEQELISIDENMVRLDLNKVEFEQCLNRGREIYEKLNPEALKVEEEDLSKVEAQKINEELPRSKQSFLDVTAQKTGLSKKVIKSAIERDAKSSEKVKKMRSLGELNATQANELIKLTPEIQDQVVDLIKEKPAKKLKELVKAIQQKGIEQAIDHVIQAPQLTPEYQQLQQLSKKLNKLCGKIILEEMIVNNQLGDQVMSELISLRDQLDQVIDLNQFDGPISLDRPSEQLESFH
jgi:ParB family chromosome partitioning protein